MHDAYDWLYDNYTKALMRKVDEYESAAVAELAKNMNLSQENTADLMDAMENLRLYCGIHTFALGLQLGMRLIFPPDYN